MKLYRVVSTFAILILLLGVSNALVNHPQTTVSLFEMGLRITTWVVSGLILLYMIRRFFRGDVGISISRVDGLKFKISIMKTSLIFELAKVAYKLFQRARLGVKDFAAFREWHEGVQVLNLSKGHFSLLASLALCYNVGVVNVIILLAFWYVCAKQFDIDFAASIHVTICEFFLGILIILLVVIFPLGTKVFVMYPVFSIGWIYLYCRDNDMRKNVVFLQLAKVCIYVSSKLVPFFILSHFKPII